MKTTSQENKQLTEKINIHRENGNMYPQYQYPKKDNNDITSTKNSIKLVKKQNKKAMSVIKILSK